MSGPALNVTTSDHEGSTLVRVDGEIDLSTARQFERDLERSGSSGGQLIVDLTAVDFMDSTAVGVLARTAKGLAQDDRRLILVCAEGVVRRVLEVSGLDQVVPVFSDLENVASS